MQYEDRSPDVPPDPPDEPDADESQSDVVAQLPAIDVDELEPEADDS